MYRAHEQESEPEHYQSRTHVISSSATHRDMWIFKSKTDNTFFALNASLPWIRRMFSPYNGSLPRRRRKKNGIL